MSNRLPLSVWPIAQQVARSQRQGRYVDESKAHPGKMLPSLAHRAIEAYTQPGDLVADPMCGIGTTLIEAIHLGRNAVGVEYERRWSDLANANIAHAVKTGASGFATAYNGDGKDIASLVDPALHGRFALVLTSPPYGPSLHGRVETGNGPVAGKRDHYSKDRTNLEYANKQNLLKAFGEILSSCATLLRPGGVVAITARPWRRDGQLIDLPGEIVALAAEIGLDPLERNVALLCGIREDSLIPRPSFFQLDWMRKSRAKGVPLSVITHEDIVVLRKPEVKQ